VPFSESIFNEADAIQTGWEHFQERFEGYQEMFVSLHRGSIQYLITKQTANLYDNSMRGIKNDYWITYPCCKYSNRLFAFQNVSGLQRRWTGVNFINVLQAAFTGEDPKSAKKTDNLAVFFVLLGSVPVKAVLKTLVKLKPGANFTNILLSFRGNCKMFGNIW